VKELSKSIERRSRDSRFARHFFVGDGVDIGGKPDPLLLYKDIFPKMASCRTWDLEDGDAQYMEGIEDGFYDFVHSSHTLEHMEDPIIAIRNWFRVLKPGGHLIITVPDEDLYEQGIFPSTFNRHHKHTFTIYKNKSWSPFSVNIFDLISSLGNQAKAKIIQLEDTFFRKDIPRFDQTRSPNTESAIEFIIEKCKILDLKPENLVPVQSWPEGIEQHYIQYLLDQKAAAEKFPEPFGETK